MILIDAENIRKTFAEGKGGQLLAIEDLSLRVRKNEFVSIVGPSGCGKSTFLLMVSRLERLSQGRLSRSSSYGFAATDTCPYFRLADVIVADTTCDGKKRMFELLARYRPVYVLQLPQNQNPQTALPFWIDEIARFKDFVEKTTGTRITPEMLSEVIRQRSNLSTPCPFCGELHIYAADDLACPLTGNLA